MTSQIQLYKEYYFPIESVWASITDKEILSQWLMTTEDFQPKLGCKFHLRSKPMGGWNGVVDCEILEIRPLEKIVMSWKGNNEKDPKKTTKLTLTLNKSSIGTRLDLKHEYFKGLGGFFLSQFILKKGWKDKIYFRIPKVLEYMKDDKTGKFPIKEKKMGSEVKG